MPREGGRSHCVNLAKATHSQQARGGGGGQQFERITAKDQLTQLPDEIPPCPNCRPKGLIPFCSSVRMDRQELPSVLNKPQKYMVSATLCHHSRGRLGRWPRASPGALPPRPCCLLPPPKPSRPCCTKPFFPPSSCFRY